MKKKDKKACSNKLVILMAICVFLSLTTLAIVAYDKFIKPEAQVPTCVKDYTGD